MPYVPPHLRNRDANASPAADGDRESDSRTNRVTANRSSSFGTERGRSDGDLDRAPSGGARGMDRAYSARPRTQEPSLDPVFVPWQPSERVLALTPEQVDDIRQRLNVTVESGAGNEAVLAPVESFLDMNLHANLLKDLASKNYERPTPIQAQGVPVALNGRDILGCAETGSGKTASFAIPMIQHCLSQKPNRPGDGPVGLVLAPTRELAQQIEKEFSTFCQSSPNIRTAIVVGGVSMGEQKSDLRSGVEIVVATPGRLIDHLQQGNTSLRRASFIVLDEADRMLDMGFEPQIKEVLHLLPAKHQTLLFSATMPVEIETLARTYLNNPVSVKIGKVSTPTANVTQRLERTTDEEKVELLMRLLGEAQAVAEQGGPPMVLTVVFVERKTRCDEVAAALNEDGIPAAALHGGLSQGDREAALRDFSAGRTKVLVATDVASRGLDISGIGHVINMDLPRTFEDYVHRIGRTGRAGTKGVATSFFTDRDMFLVSQIRGALSDVEAGRATQFAAGKAARQQERQLAQKFKDNMRMSSQGVVAVGAAPVKVDDRYAFMANSSAAGGTGAADAAWDD